MKPSKADKQVESSDYTDEQIADFVKDIASGMKLVAGSEEVKFSDFHHDMGFSCFMRLEDIRQAYADLDNAELGRIFRRMITESLQSKVKDAIDDSGEEPELVTTIKPFFRTKAA